MALPNESTSKNLTVPFEQLPFVLTSVARKVHEVAEVCYSSGMIGLVVGASGLGKTRSIEEYASKNPSVIMIRAHARYSIKDIFSDIHIAVGYDGRGNIHHMMNDIVIGLKGRKKLIVIDESEHLTANALDEVRQINDRARVGVLYVGLERFRSQMRNVRTGYECIASRVRFPARVSALKLNDVEQLVKSVMPNANGLCKDFFEMSGGNVRALETILLNSFRSAKISGAEINSDLVKQVALAVAM